MAYTIITNGHHDRAFLENCAVGFDSFRDYVLGAEDGVAKTPAWAEKITGVPAATVERLALEYARAKPAAFIPGWGPARSAMGEQFTRAASTLCAISGNVGKEGGFSGGFMLFSRLPGVGLGRPRNPLDRGMPPRPNSLHKIRGAGNPTSARIHGVKVAEAILKGKAGGYPCDPKMAYVVASNFLNSHPDTNQGIAAFKKLEFIVVQTAPDSDGYVCRYHPAGDDIAGTRGYPCTVV
jgi:anaerobic dimethyl sulfoxide reductase subunit A